MSDACPYLSVIVPAHRGEIVLRQSLPALLASDLPRPEWELIVVDDASGDRTPEVAGEYADLVLALDDRPRGPAHARNQGACAARGAILMFVDADVCVHTDTLSAIAAAFRAEPDLGALFGSYDARPPSPGLVSQFRNLLHHHVHQLNAGAAETFWAGCGAVRKSVFMAVGMLDASKYPRPQIEDIELGRRLRRAGHRIELRPEIQCTHLKRWTLRNMVITDFRDRGVPWMRLLLSEGKNVPATLNLRSEQKLSTALVAVCALALLTALFTWDLLSLLLAAVAVLGIVILNLRFYRLLARGRSPGFAIAALPLHLLFFFIGGLGAVVGALLFYGERWFRPEARADVPGTRPTAARGGNGGLADVRRIK